ncbi:MAG TPA: TIGR04255 family protein [Bryobacteraceae bacterium]|nr:TIGR04255 family protein [Bryobacteraceae bacterium]
MTYDLKSVFPTLRRAPISEATIDIQVTLLPDVNLEKLRAFHRGLEQRFPLVEDRMRVAALLQMNKAASPAITSQGPTPDGLLMRSESEALVVQARLDGFSLNKLAPYAKWDALRAQAQELWQRYLDVAGPVAVKRLAVRYINRIELEPGVDFKESILTVPEIAPGIPQGLPEYFMRLVIPHESGSTAIVTQASLPPTFDMLFDIDVFRFTDIRASDFEEIWPTLEELRAYKNVIFFNSITPKQMEKYA